MKWLADECIAAWLVSRLRDAGHDVTYILEQSPSSTDREILDAAMGERRLLLTEDRDFGELVFGETAARSSALFICEFRMNAHI